MKTKARASHIDWVETNASGMSIVGLPSAWWALDYDHHNRLIEVSEPGSTTEFGYDTDGNRVLQDDGSETVISVGDDYQVTVPTSGPRTETIYYSLAGEPVGYSTDGALTYTFGDHLDSIAATYTASSGAIDRQFYYPYGHIRHTDTLGTDYGYTHQHHDSTGLMFYQARYYDPTLRRFAQADSIVPNPSDPQDLNRYTYAVGIGSGLNPSGSSTGNIAVFIWDQTRSAGVGGAQEGYLERVGG